MNAKHVKSWNMAELTYMKRRLPELIESDPIGRVIRQRALALVEAELERRDFSARDYANGRGQAATNLRTRDIAQKEIRERIANAEQNMADRIGPSSQSYFAGLINRYREALV